MSARRRHEFPDRLAMPHPRVIAQSAVAVLLLGAAVASFFLVYTLLPEANQFGRDRTMRDLMAALRILWQCPEKGTASTRCNGQVLTIEELLDHMNKREFTFFGAGFFDAYIAKDTVVLKRRPCAKADVAGRVVGWSVWSSGSKPLSPQQQSYGEFGEFLPFDDHGYMVGETCLMAFRLPVENIGRIFALFLDESRSKSFWKLDWHQ
jgi:hypothetical protein